MIPNTNSCIPPNNAIPAIKLVQRAAEETKIRVCRAANDRAPKHWMAGEDVVADAGMNGERNAVTIRIRQHGSFFVGVLDRV